MAKKKKAKIKTPKRKTVKGRAAPKVQIRTNGTKVQGQVNIPYVQTGIPENHAVDVCEALAQLILSDVHRGYVGVTAKGDFNE